MCWLQNERKKQCIYMNRLQQCVHVGSRRTAAKQNDQDANKAFDLNFWGHLDQKSMFSNSKYLVTVITPEKNGSDLRPPCMTLLITFVFDGGALVRPLAIKCMYQISFQLSFVCLISDFTRKRLCY